MGHRRSTQPDGAAILSRFADLTVWSRRGERAPHKPLLVLYALGRWAGGDRGPIPFADVRRDLGNLLREFGPPRAQVHPEYPFWRLQRDGVWEVDAGGSPLTPRKGNTDPVVSDLLAANAVGRFTDDVQQALAADPPLTAAVAHRLLDAHFPPTLHADILAAVGLDLDAACGVRAVRPRDRRFREAVLTAYGYACCVCGLSVRLGREPAALDAAHIRWHQAEGPDEVPNGLCLCVLHHHLFDRGGFTVEPAECRVVVSDHVSGVGADDALTRFHGRPLTPTTRSDGRPAAEHLEWHRSEVFRGMSRG